MRNRRFFQTAAVHTIGVYGLAARGTRPCRTFGKACRDAWRRLLRAGSSTGRSALVAAVGLVALVLCVAAPASAREYSTFRLKHSVSGLYLVPDYNGDRDDKRNVSAREDTGGDEFRWFVQSAGREGEHYIVNLKTGLLLTWDGDDSNVSTWGYMGWKSEGQMWAFRSGAAEGHSTNERQLINIGNREFLTQHSYGHDADERNVTTVAGEWQFREEDGLIWHMEEAGTEEISKLTLLKVKCISPSTGQDDATAALFSGIEVVGQVAAAAATGGASAAGSAAAAGAKAAVRSGAKILSKQTLQAAAKAVTKKAVLRAAKRKAERKVAKVALGSAATLASGSNPIDDYTSLQGLFNKVYGESPDDLTVHVNGRSIWPNGGRSDREISSQQEINTNTEYLFKHSDGLVLELIEYDSGSDNDTLGTVAWDPATGTIGRQMEDVIVSNKSEGSIYLVTFRVQDDFYGFSNFATEDFYREDLRGHDFTDQDLSELNLAGKNLTGANLTGADLAGMDLTKTNLINANLTDADLSGTRLTQARLSGAVLTGAKLRQVDLTLADLSGQSLVDADLTGADLSKASLINTDLRGATLVGANLTLANLANANLIDADLSDATLDGADLNGATVAPASTIGIDFSKWSERGGTVEMQITGEEALLLLAGWLEALNARDFKYYSSFYPERHRSVITSYIADPRGKDFQVIQRSRELQKWQVDVAAEDIEVEVEGDTATVEFFQRMNSEDEALNKAETGRKMMQVKMFPDGAKIVREEIRPVEVAW